MLLAAVLALGLNSTNIDLGLLSQHYRNQQRSDADGVRSVCGIKVVGYRILGEPGQQFGYARETFTIPDEGYVEVIALPRVRHYTFMGRKLPLSAGQDPVLDPFGFRWITLPAAPAREGVTHE